MATRSGIPAETIRKEQEARLRQEPVPAIHLAAPPPLRTPGNGRQQVTLPNDQTIARHKTKETPSHPTLDDNERALLAFISEHPETPVSRLYKALGVGVWKGEKLRESLTRQGLLCELELRTGATTPGRPGKFLIPTFSAFELLGIAPPKGRGGSVHRFIQQVVADGARAKGYSVQCEHILPTGGIVDVHLEKGQERIAVEIAIASAPEREMSHMRECLQAGYDRVFAVFADENLLRKTQEALPQMFSAEELGKVRLLPVSKLAHLDT